MVCELRVPGKHPAPFSLLVITLFVLLPLYTAATTQDDQYSAQKRAEFDRNLDLYRQVIVDHPDIMDLLDRAGSQRLSDGEIDNLLIRLPQSPLDIFEMHWFLAHHEVAVPKYIGELDERWQRFHPQYPIRLLGNSTTDAPDMLSQFLAPIVPMAPVVSTNRDEAYTYPTPPTEYQGEVQLFVNRNNTQQLVDSGNTWRACGANPNGTQDIYATTDGGVTWNNNCAPDAAAYTGLSCGGTHYGSDPAIAWDTSGNAYLNYMMICGSNAAMVVAKSTDAGTSWNPLGVLTGYANLNDKNMYVIDNTSTSPYVNRHYSCWDLNNDERIAYSSNGGASWTLVNTPSGAKTVDIGCDMAVRDDGHVYLNWDGLTCGANCTANDTYFSRSTNGGVNWSAAVTVAANKNMIGFSAQTQPPAADQRGIAGFGNIDIDNNPASACYHTLYIAYTDMPASGSSRTPANVYLKRSTDEGATWSSAVQINDDAVGTASTTTQFNVWIAVDQTDGSVIAGWQDSRNFSSNNRRVETYAARSINCGVSFESNIKVSAASTEFNNNSITYTDENSTDNTGANGNNFGEYMGVDAHNRIAYTSWSDTRQFYPTNTGTQKENLAFASLTFCSAPTSLAAPTATPTCIGGNPKVDLSWSAPSWGTNATGGTYSVERATSIGGPYSTIVSGLSGTTYTDSTVASSTTYFYRIVATNNCPGTALTPMSSTSASTSATACPKVEYSSFGTLTQVCGDGDAYVEPGEKWNVTVTLANTGSSTANNTHATLAVNAGSSVSATITGNPGSYGGIAAGSNGSATYVFEVDSGATCVNNLTFDLTSISSDEGSYSNATAAFVISVGQLNIETGTQSTSPLTANNSANTTTFTPAFSIPSPDSASLTYTLAYNKSSAPVDLVLQPSSQDARIRRGSGTTNFGSETTMIVGATGTTTATINRALVQFDLSSIPAGSTINSADLELYATAKDTSADNVTENIQRITASWTEGGATWNNMNANFDAAVSGTFSPGTTTGVFKTSTSLVSLVQAWVNGTYSNYGMMIKDPTESTANTAWTYATKENATTANRPILRINYTAPAITDPTTNTKVELIRPSGPDVLLKDFGVANATPYDILSSYVGAGTYSLRLTENNGGTATITGGVMSVSKILCNVSSCSAPPAEVSGGSWSGTKDTWSWSTEANSTSYRVYRGAPSDLPGLLDSTVDSCKRYDGAAINTSNILTETPAAGSFYWYVVVGVNSAGEGSAGNATSGARVINSSGTCP